ncbi:ribonucleoside-triphosphate reductase class III catalytic subunit [Pelagirhabdus alkalitolerans]|uniref:Ribonucleoside-triphosphate reductase class III catalytic subunit n=1 Tax=Pelagirhabdus alkalitolerans TaxID=1612202 RepID=A0A1G6GHG4_9BACI|nr:anaerobic ribonucleoside triphosphate reductase [Pelagirhabdus alkalitolerans]SDB81195.1 ribonucleoside-triphosphate reductase class III catalytic subunit [Pelagirhabdus alkalitolerans]
MQTLTPRKANTDSLIDQLDEIVASENQDLIQENANVDGQSPMGQMSKFGSEAAKHYAKTKLLSGDVVEAMNDNFIHPHDLDFLPTGTTTCAQIPLGAILKGGFNTGHGFMREPGDITSAMALSSIIFQSNQNMQHGGQSYPMFDYDLAPYVRKSYEKHRKKLLGYPVEWDEDTLEKTAWKEAERDVFQACEAFIHNCNSMHSRGGGQVPFVSINYGTDTSVEGRLLIKNLLLATKDGLGNGETPIFPIQIFKMKRGVNFEREDKNYDLYQLALETTAKRLFPNFSFIDSSVNVQHYDGTPESEVSYMGCRTRVMANRHGDDNSIQRGNLSFTSVNLVKTALVSSSVSEFFDSLGGTVDLVIKQLLERFEFQAKKQAQHFSFLYGQGVWKDSEDLKPTDSLREVLKQGTLSVGFIGLAECLVALTGKHHGESEASLELGYEIVQFMRERVDWASKQYDLNFSLIATPAEGLSGRFTRGDRDEFGLIPGVTEHDYYTNSFHVPVYYSIRAIDKIRIEGRFHELCNGGHISYIECDGDVTKNTKALDVLVKAMAENDFGYGSINHPVDRCEPCGYTGIINEECPKCGNRDQDQVERIRRITGYLVGDMKKWNTAKRAEEQERVKHGQ